MKKYKICAVYDTETTDIGECAFPYAFIINDIRNVQLSEYQHYCTRNIEIYRTEAEIQRYLVELMEWGERFNTVPIVCAYNLSFDLQPLLDWLYSEFGDSVKICARNSASLYTLDIIGTGDRSILRFWDVFNLEPRGLAKMGEVCGVPKLTGDLDYSLIRTPSTPLAAPEIEYMFHDVEIIPRYLASLLEQYPWLNEEDLGTKVITATSLVRQMAAHEIGVLRLGGKRLDQRFMSLCRENMAPDYHSYAARKACFRGGLTFTGSKWAFQKLSNVYSLDVVSMHHTFINQPTPIDFQPTDAETLAAACHQILLETPDTILKHYAYPFPAAFHACIEFENVRPCRGSVFELHGIQTLSRAKFKRSAPRYVNGNESSLAAENGVRANEYLDVAEGVIFEFSKLVSAKRCRLFLSELEFWIFAQAYEFDEFTPIFGEITTKYSMPPAYVSLQSNMLYERKKAMKSILQAYECGVKNLALEPWTKHLSAALAESILSGEAEIEDLESYYKLAIKGPFNAIYGTQAQDIFKPDWELTGEGFEIDLETLANELSYAALRKSKRAPKVLYPYGLRIVGRSRLHLALAMMLLHAEYGDLIKIGGGDTDSLKISLPADITPGDLLKCLEPLHRSTAKALEIGQREIKTNFGKFAANLGSVGFFEIENKKPLAEIELWNKCRVSESPTNTKISITCAGLAKREGVSAWNMEGAIYSMRLTGIPLARAVDLAMGFNARICFELSCYFHKRSPKPRDVITAEIRDYLGAPCEVRAHQSVQLVQDSQELAPTHQAVNIENLKALNKNGVYPQFQPRYVNIVRFESGVPYLVIKDEYSEEVLASCRLYKNGNPSEVVN